MKYKIYICSEAAKCDFPFHFYGTNIGYVYTSNVKLQVQDTGKTIKIDKCYFLCFNCTKTLLGRTELINCHGLTTLRDNFIGIL